MTTIKTYKIALLGDSFTGKSAFIKRHRTGEFDGRFNSTVSFDRSTLRFNTDKGKIYFEVYDVCGHDRSLDTIKSYINNAYTSNIDAAILFFDITSMPTYISIKMWHQIVVDIYGNIPVVICGNKVDIRKNNIKAKYITYHREKSLSYFNVSAKSLYHFDRPFLHLSRMFLDYNVKFISYV